MHGEDYLCLGFLFGEKCKVAYISDISRFPSSTEYGEYWFSPLVSIDIHTTHAHTHMRMYVCIYPLYLHVSNYTSTTANIEMGPLFDGIHL